MKKTLTILILASFCVTSCATMFGNKNRTINITSNPPQARVEYNGQYFGTTPTNVVVNSTFNTGLVSVSKKGYKTSYRQVENKFQLVGILNIFFWPGFIIDLATGDTMRLDTFHINFELEEDAK